MSHTPGYWRTGTKVGRTVYADDKLIGVMDRIEDARLIAAAPDLLEALKNIENDDGSIPGTIWAMCIAAIAKAEGR